MFLGLVVVVADLPFAALVCGRHAAYTCSLALIESHCLLFGATSVLQAVAAVSPALPRTLRCAL